ncbi:MAG: hypothetical protein JKX76_02410 [Colwellia sp.]|nr:hypothetical protein [Colwellia sp.]
MPYHNNSQILPEYQPSMNPMKISSGRRSQECATFGQRIRGGDRSAMGVSQENSNNGLYASYDDQGMDGNKSAIQYTTSTLFDENHLRFIGWDPDNQATSAYFSDSMVSVISKQITEILMGVHPSGRPIEVPDTSISHVMSEVFNAHTPQVGDIHSRFIIEGGNDARNDITTMIDRTIEIITSQIRDSYEIEEQNSKLNIWTTVLGDFNEHGLRSHPKIKLKERRPTSFQFHMRY